MEKVTVPASTEKLQPIFCNHIRMSLGANNLAYFDLRAVLPDFSNKNETELEGKKIHVSLDEECTPPHTRIVMPMETVIALRRMLLNSIEEIDPGSSTDESSISIDDTV